MANAKKNSLNNRDKITENSEFINSAIDGLMPELENLLKDNEEVVEPATKQIESMSRKELEKVKKQIEKNMHKAAAELNFEEAAVLRDKMIEVNKFLYETK